MRLWSALILILLVTAAPASAGATDKVKARDLYHAGLQHYNLGEFSDALASFKEAYRNFESPSFLFNIGQCQRQLGHRQEALNSFRAYLREESNAPNHDSVMALIRELEHSLSDKPETAPPVETESAPAHAADKEPPAAPPTKLALPAEATTPPPSAEHVLRMTAPAPRTPVYKKWYFWTPICLVAAAGATVAVVLTRGPSYGTSSTDGNFHF